MVADACNEIPSDRQLCRHRATCVQLHLGVEDNPVLYCLLGFRLLRAMTRLKPRKNCLGRNAPSRIPLELAQARRDFLAQPSIPLRFEILEHTQAGANNLTGIVVAA